MSRNVATQLTGRTAVELAGQVQRGEVAAVEVVQAFLDRIDALEPSLHALQVVRRERALQEAKRLDARADRASLPLAGVPVAIKDNVAVAGEPTRFGSRATSDAPAAEDDVLVQRLRAAGAIVIGKTSMPELAIWPFTEPLAFGPSHNPWDPMRTPGGSSGGSAAAVAARMAPLALGSDGGGSIRIPAACCGIVGLKPGPGVVPLGAGAREHWCGMSEFGPLAGTVRDAALMLDVLSGKDELRSVEPASSGLRIAFSTATPAIGARVSREVKAAVSRTVAHLSSAGHQVDEDDPPYTASLAWRFGRRWAAGIAHDADALVRDHALLEDQTRALVEKGRWVIRRGAAQSAAEDGFGAQMRQWLSRYDVLLVPTFAHPAIPVGKWLGKGWVRTVLGVSGWILTPQWNLARLPALSIPAGTSAEGLPLAVQLVGSERSEAKLLSLALQLEVLQPFPKWEG